MRPRTLSLFAALVLVAALLMTSGGGVVAQGPLPPQGSNSQGPEATATNGNADGVFTYQGQLKSSGSPYNGTCDFKFELYQTATESDLVAQYTDLNILVSNGLFSAPVSYQNWGPQRWLAISVRCPAGSGSYVLLSPREKITAAPYANTLRPGAEIVAVDTAGSYLSDVYLSAGNVGYGIYSAGYPTGTVGVAGYVYNNTSQTGVLGVATKAGRFNTNYGVVGLASLGSYGTLASRPTALYDAAGAFAGPNGVIGIASPDSGDGYGVTGISTGTAGIGVFGYTTAATGGAYGVYGKSISTSGSGVVGLKQSASTMNSSGFWTPAVLGTTSTGNGVIGNASANSADGVIGMTSGSGANGVLGTATGADSRGVYGKSSYTGTTGVYGYVSGPSSHAVEGYASNPSSWAGYFTGSGGGVYISVPPGYFGLNVAGGTKNAVVPTDSGARLMYSEESTQVWFTDYGFGKLDKGAMVVKIDPLFAQTVILTESYHVFVQSYGDADLYVSNRTPTSFEVHLRGSGDAGVEFSYRIVAMRQGYENARLGAAPWADNDPNLYPQGQTTQTPASADRGANGNGPVVPGPVFSDPSQRQSPGAP